VLKEPKDIAGLKIITDAGTNQKKILLESDRQNVAAGLKPIEVQYYDDDAVRNLAVQAGRADAQPRKRYGDYAAGRHARTLAP
jgi:polar amino acid transport system substrate-binding protein